MVTIKATILIAAKIVNVLRKAQPMNHTLIIRHLPIDNGIGQFRVENVNPNMAGKATNPTEITSPDEIIVEGRPKSNLLQDLSWYLENFLAYPFSPNTETADRVTKTLQQWGEDTFTKLFSGKARDWFVEMNHGTGEPWDRHFNCWIRQLYICVFSFKSK